MKTTPFFPRLLMLFSLSAIAFACSDQRTTEVSGHSEIKKESTILTLTDIQTNAVHLNTTTLTEREMQLNIRLAGKVSVSPDHQASVSSMMGGHVRSLDVLPGEKVKKGQVLAVLEDSGFIQLQQDYLVTKAQFDAARLNYERQKELNSGKIASDKILETSHAEYQTLAVRKKAYEERLRLVQLDPEMLNAQNIRNNILVYAPFDGNIQQVLANKGQYVAPSDVIVEMINPDGLLLDLKAFEKDLKSLQVGQYLEAFTNMAPSVRIPAKIVSKVSNVAADGSTSIYARMMKTGPDVFPGMHINAEVSVKQKTSNVLPKESIVFFDSQEFIFEKTNKNSYRIIAIETGLADDRFVEVSSSESLVGKQIVTQGAYDLLMALRNTATE